MSILSITSMVLATDRRRLVPFLIGISRLFQFKGSVRVFVREQEIERLFDNSRIKT